MLSFVVNLHRKLFGQLQPALLLAITAVLIGVDPINPTRWKLPRSVVVFHGAGGSLKCGNLALVYYADWFLERW